MESDITGEQPDLLTPQNVATRNDTVIADDKGGEGSPTSKFKSVDELAKAYENLEKEFTRKSQALAELNKTQNIDKEQLQTKPVYETEGWHAKVADFKLKHPEAEKYSAQIAELILRSQTVKNSAEPLLAAYAEVIGAEFKEREVLATDPEFINQVIKKPEIRERVIKEYLSSISALSELPRVISTKVGAALGNELRSVPATLREAKKMAEKMIQG